MMFAGMSEKMRNPFLPFFAGIQSGPSVKRSFEEIVLRCAVGGNRFSEISGA